MSKEELVGIVAEECSQSKTASRGCIDATFEAITNCLKKGDSISINGFGTFKISPRKKRMGINPQTQERIEIPAKKAPVFKASSVLKKKM